MTKNTHAGDRGSSFRKTIAPALLVFAAGLVIFGVVSGERLLHHSPDNHYVYLADALIHGRLHLDGNPPHLNDWAKHNGKWYVSFPPVPAILMIPAVALSGLDFNDRLFTLVFAAAGPALLFWLLLTLARQGRIKRKPWEIAVLSAIYGIGSVYFFAAVQGSVWFTAHMVGGVMLLLFMIFSLEGRHPFVAGLFLGLAFATRPPMLLAFPFYLYEMLRFQSAENTSGLVRWIPQALRNAGGKKIAKQLILFGLPIVLIIAGMMAMNWARFDDPFEFGHRHLQVRWAGRIERWGLFHYHYLARNLSVSLTLLPWLSAQEPYIQISRHGLAIWLTTPIFFWVLWPKNRSHFYTVVALTVCSIALPSLLYQNSGWIQFGYRFSLDYTAFLFLMIACSGRKLGKLFFALGIFAVAINLFGAVTFDRMHEYYPSQSTTSYFQPD